MGRRTGIPEQRLTPGVVRPADRGRPSPLPRLIAAAVLILGIAFDLSPVTPLTSEEPEFSIPTLDPILEWTYTWKTSGLLSLLFPDSGVGYLRVEDSVDGSFRAELRVDTDGEPFWLTGAVIDAETLTACEIWSTYRWRGRERTRLRQVEQSGVVDMLSTILTLRRDLPQEDTPLEFQAGSTVYPIVARRTLPAVYVLEDRDGHRGRRWNKSAEVSFADDSRRSPQHIALIERLIRIDLELVDGG